MEKSSMENLGRLSVSDFKSTAKHPLVLVLDGVRSGLNVGSIFRTADAFALEQVVLCGITAQPPHREILKTALGSTESVVWSYYEDTVQAVHALKQEGYLVFAIEQTTQKIWLQDFQTQPGQRYAFVLGNEVEGVTEDVLALCDGALEIPQFGTKHSLNVAVAAGIVAWEFVRKYLFTILLSMSICFLYAQSKYDYHWTIGYDTSLLDPGGDVILMDFNQSPVNVQTKKTVEKFSSEFSTSTMSDSEGNLIFYTSGCYVVNAMHEKMENGDSINPGIQQQFCCPFAGSCNLGGAISIPWPDSPHLYLLFINDYVSDLFPNDPTHSGASGHLYYNIIDMQKDAGLGAVTLKNQVAIDDTLATNSVEACRHSNGRDWWVMIPKSRTSCYFLVLVTPEGVGIPKLTCAGIPYNKFEDAGQSCFSPDGKKFVRFNRDNGVHIYDFDNTTGELSNETWFKINDLGSYVVGAAISPNSRYLYISGFDKLLQYDLNAADIENSRVLLAVPDNVPDPFVPSVFALSALAPDGKIYISSVSSHLSLHVIHRPDCGGLYSLPERRGLPITSWNYGTIPNMPHFRNEPSSYPCDSFVVHTYTPIDGRESIVVFPNPAVDQVTIRLNHPLPKGTWWILHDQLGREVKRVLLDSDEVELSVSLNDYPPGIFYFSVISDTRLVQRGKLILLR